MAVESPPAATCTSGANLLPSPQTGAPPLMVSFVVSIPSGATIPVYSWTFGDGSYWNGSGAGYSAPTHLYVGGGLFTAIVTVDAPPTSYRCSAEISVRSTQVLARIVATPGSGVAPVRVAFQAVVYGGTGTYTRFNWSFGDGASGAGVQINHTYTLTGQFRVALNVTDTNGSVGSAETQIGVTPPSSPNPVPLWLRSAETWAPWVLAGLIVVLVVVLIVVARRFPLSSRPGGEPRINAPQVGRIAGPPTPDPAELARRAPTAPSPGMRGSAQAPKVSTTRDIHPSRELLDASERIIIHLAAQGSLRSDEVATASFTQAGIQQVLAMSQGSTSNALRRLELAEVVQHDVRHVRGVRRRVRVYTLTGRGYALARELRGR